MRHVSAVLSMLHEPPGHGSATRLFRGDPVLSWTLQRVNRARGVGTATVLCWEDQLPDVQEIAAEACAYVLAKGPRQSIAAVEAVAAARRWSDGWRGGPLGTCEFDLGFHARWIAEIAATLDSEAVLLVDPASALVDPVLLDGIIAHAQSHAQSDLVFSQAAPGLSGALLRCKLLERLASAGTHPGRLLHYLPDAPARDPIGTESCAPVPTPVARSLHRFKLDSDRQIARIAAATLSLNGQLISTEAEQLVRHMDQLAGAAALAGDWPREVVLELTTRRATRALFRAGTHQPIDRPDLPLDLARNLFDELAGCDDLRLTLSGVGDPLLAENAMDVIDAAVAAGIAAVHVETDLLGLAPEGLQRLGRCGADVISVHLPAIQATTYTKLMGVDAYPRVVENIKTVLAWRQSGSRGTPLVVPVFTKCSANLAEMEPWYDQWLRALGSAVIVGPSDLAGQIADAGVADMSPPHRRPCARLASRLSILSDGRAVSCEQDVLGRQVLGQIGPRQQTIQTLWQRTGTIRQSHQRGQWDAHELCRTCREWHRP